MPDSRRSALRAWVPIVLSLLVQLATTGAALRGHGLPGQLRDFGRPCCDVAVGPGPSASVGHAGLSLAVAFLLILLAVVGPALLPAVRGRPVPALVIITAAAVGGTVLCADHGIGSPFYLSVLFGAAAAVFQRRRPWAWGAVGAYWLSYALAYLVAGEPLQLGWLVPLTILSVGSLAGPEFARNRREARSRMLRELEARRVEEAQVERVRIARELHDVLAHSLSQINVQASVGLHLFGTEPEKAAEALANVKETSKQALGEVRQVLGMLRGDEVPLTPDRGLAGIRELVDGVGAQGLETTLKFEVTDVSSVPAAVQQAAYRIVQEALTNVNKHARARRVEVAVVASTRGGASVLRLSVDDDGVGASAAPSSDGRGLLGMRERAELLGGRFEAGPREGGGFAVAAELPLGGGA